MKRMIFIGAIVLCIVFFSLHYRTVESEDDQGRSAHRVVLGDTTLFVEFARTTKEHQQGLMYRKELVSDAGMLFLFPQMGVKTFWNKNTLIPLDIIWMRGDLVIGTSSLPSINVGLTTVTSPEETDRVLEVNYGWSTKHDIQIGARMW